MSATPAPKRMTVAEYLAHERAAEYKSDFIDGRLYPVHDPYRGMPTTTEDGSLHVALKGNVHRCFTEQIAASGANAFVCGEGVRVTTDGGPVAPDVVVTDGLLEWDGATGAVRNPRVVVEVVSDDTVRRDCHERLTAYRRMPSVPVVVFVWDRDRFMQRYVARDDGGWTVWFADDLSTDLALDSYALRLPLADVYRGVERLNDLGSGSPHARV